MRLQYFLKQFYYRIKYRFIIRQAEIKIRYATSYDILAIAGYCEDPVQIILLDINQKHGINGELHRLIQGGHITETLYHIIENESKYDIPLPVEYIREVEKRIITPCKKAHKGNLIFQVSDKGITIEEIKRNQENWNKWCRLAWAGCN
jgi:hypothetical protein